MTKIEMSQGSGIALPPGAGEGRGGDVHLVQGDSSVKGLPIAFRNAKGSEIVRIASDGITVVHESFFLDPNLTLYRNLFVWLTVCTGSTGKNPAPDFAFIMQPGLGRADAPDGDIQLKSPDGDLVYCSETDTWLFKKDGEVQTLSDPDVVRALTVWSRTACKTLLGFSV